MVASMLLGICCVLAQTGPGGAPATAGKATLPEELKKAAAALVDAKSYAFEAVVETKGAAFGGGRGGRGARGGTGGGATGGAANPAAGGGNAPADGPLTTTGKYEKGKPVALSRDDLTAYRLDTQLVYEHDGQWDLFTGMGGNGGRAAGGRGGAQDGAAAPSAPASGAPASGAPASGAAPANGPGATGQRGAMGFGGDLRRMTALMTFQNVPLPHELLAELDSAFGECHCDEVDGKLRYTGPLTAATADRLSGAARVRDMLERFGSGAGDLAASGTLEVVVAKDGTLESLHFETKFKNPGGGEQTRKVDLKLSGVGSTTVDVPKEVLAKLST